MQSATFLTLPLRLLAILVLAAGVGCNTHSSHQVPVSARKLAPIRLLGLDVQEPGGVRTLFQDESLRAHQDFAIRIATKEPSYLYVVLDHADSRHALLHPRPGAPPALTAVGTLQLPAPGDWFYLENTEAGDRLCLVISEVPLSLLSCTADASRRRPDRGEDTPPPPRTQKVALPPPPPPPPDDTDDKRGHRRWVLELPLATPGRTATKL